MPISDRDYVRGKHPPTCTCKECTEKRLGKFLGQNRGKGKKDSPKTKPASGGSSIPPISLQTMRGSLFHRFSRIWRKIPLSVHKLFLSLLIIAGLVDIIQRGYTLFTHQTDPIKNTIIFLIEIGLWFWIVAILRGRRYRYRQPKFKVVLITIIAITLVCTFAGIEPLSSYKDNLFNSVSDYLEERQAIREAAEIAAEEARLKAEVLAKAEAERKAEEEAERIVQEALKAERLAFDMINKIRMLNGILPTKWDDELYRLSKAHTQAMSDKGELFHTPMDAPYGENAWGGIGYSNYDYEELAEVIVNSWMSSPLHKAWILHEPLQTSVASIIITPNSQFASWTFWTGEAGEGPELVKKIADEWRRETGESIPWIEWLYMKGYLD